jgi:DNA mismatch repair protein MutL
MHNKRSILEFPRPQSDYDNRCDRITSLYNTQFMETALPVEEKTLQIALSGWISAPDFSRSQTDWQYFYMNGRLIKDKILSHAVKQAYQDILYRGRQPAVILFLEIEPAEVDVNVHPAKAEVRFRQPQTIYDFIYKAIKKVLATPHLCSPTPLTEPLTINTKQLEAQWEEIGYAFQKKEFSFPEKNDFPPILPTELSQINTSPITPTQLPPSRLTPPISQPTELALSVSEHPLGYALAQLHHTYILAQNNEGLIVVDTHAAHERILYEKFKQAVRNQLEPSQLLLVPIILSLNLQEVELATIHHKLFQHIGFDYEVMSDNTIKVLSIPNWLEEDSIDVLIRGTLSDLNHYETSLRLEEKRNHLLGTLACHRATRANQVLSIQEMNHLLRLIEITPHSGQCNHGRPTWKQITLPELDSWFLRGR